MSAVALASAVTIIALVADEEISLRAAPRENAPVQARLSRGDWLEVRGEIAGYLQVYHHPKERPGYVKPSQVRVHRVTDAATFSMMAGFLRDLSGFETLGIAYATLARMELGPQQHDAALSEAIGTMAERLARRASRNNGDAARNGVLVGQLQVAQQWGIRLLSVEEGENIRTCYDGQAFKDALVEGAQGAIAVRAALGLAKTRCFGESDVTKQRELNEERCALLRDVHTQGAPDFLVQLLRLHRAHAYAELAFARARLGDRKSAQEAATDAVQSIMGLQKASLAEEDRPLADEAALRVASSRWAAQPASPLPQMLSLEKSAERPGETCIRVGELRNCTYGLVWESAVIVSPKKDAVAMVVQPLSSWTELWVFHRAGEKWKLDILLPPAKEPGVGYVEAAGFSPDAKKLLVAREAMVDGRLESRFQILASDSMQVERWTRNPDDLSAFKRWASPHWRGTSIAMRSR